MSAIPPVFNPSISQREAIALAEREESSKKLPEDREADVFSSSLTSASAIPLTFTPLSGVQLVHKSIEDAVEKIVALFEEKLDIDHSSSEKEDEEDTLVESLRKKKREKTKVLEEQGDTTSIDQAIEKIQEDRAQNAKSIRILDDKSKQLAEEIAKEEKQLIDWVNGYLGQRDLIKKLPIEFSRGVYLSPERKKEDIELKKEMLSNQLKNITFFIEEVKRTIERKKGEILREFSQVNVEGIALQQVSVELQILGDETHNRGKSAVLVTLCHAGKTLAKTVYKPRGGETEIAVLKLFKDLNALQPKRGADLPFFKIIKLEEEASLCQFIEGEQLHTFAKEHLDMMRTGVIAMQPPLTAEELIKAEENLVRLHTISQRIGLIDLHHENIILRNRIEWVPIDLEVISPGLGLATGLYGPLQGPEAIKLSEEEERLIEQFNETQGMRLMRVVPVMTAQFLNASIDLEGAAKIAEETYKGLESFGFNIVLSLSELNDLIKRDFKNKDIPIFTQKNKILYYGSEEIEIGAKNENM